ncbi:MAG: tRNA pseudouridine(55) synthase TruB [Pirellulaceae bacterium]|nr:tRNA pseudouridine(55) synthase TruB [Pirellulaceae bacterium]
MDGLLSLYKPQGLTSRDVVNRVQRLVKPAKCGHAGTLDPLAQGVLVVCLGKGTRLISYIQQMAKTYVGTFQLGIESDTEDTTGKLTMLEDPPVPSEANLRSVLPTFVGEILQQPPIYSALKIKGKKAYELARQGKKVELAPRNIRIDSLELLDYTYPNFTLKIQCGSGTYIRSLGRDIGKRLGTAAAMSALERTAIGDFTVENSVSLEEVTTLNDLSKKIGPMSEGVSQLPRVDLSDRQLKKLEHGQLFSREELGVSVGSGCGEKRLSVEELKNIALAAFSAKGDLVAILTVSKSGDFKPSCNFVV